MSVNYYCVCYFSQAQRITSSALTLMLTYICVHSVPMFLAMRVNCPWHRADNSFPRAAVTIVPVLSWLGAYLNTGAIYIWFCMDFYLVC